MCAEQNQDGRGETYRKDRESQVRTERRKFSGRIDKVRQRGAKSGGMNKNREIDIVGNNEDREISYQ
jgi:hypothetical protein